MSPRETLERLAACTVADCMTPDPITLSAGETCFWALRVMSAANVRHLPVLERGRLVGLVTAGDVYRRAPAGPAGHDAAAAETILEHAKVAGVMSYDPPTIRRSATLREAIGLMLEKHIGCLPVLDGSKLIGVLTHEDVIRLLDAALAGSLPPRPEGDGRPKRLTLAHPTPK